MTSMYRFVPTLSMGDELRRNDVFRGEEYIGAVVYVARRKKTGAGSASSTGFETVYGWRPDGWRYAKNTKLSTREEAADRLRGVV